MALDLTTLPLDDIKVLWDAFRNKTFSWSLVPVALDVAKWIVKALGGEALSPIGAAPPAHAASLLITSDEVASVEALINGEVAADPEPGAVAGPGGLLASAALTALLKVIAKQLLSLIA